MAFLSSLFQTGTPVPQVAGPMVTTSKLPEELAPFYKDILGKPYQGPTIAEFSPEQQQAFTGIAGLQGQQKPLFDEAMGMTRGAAAPITGEQITEYMSPYQQAVTDIEKREAQKTYESQVQPQLAAQAAQAQAFGGSRQGILEGMAADTQQRLQADIQAKGSQQAYQEAIRRLEAERTRTGQAGAQLATMGPSALKAQLGEFGALQTIGEEKQQQTQTALDEAFRQYALEQNYPYDTMSKYQSVVTGAPVQTTQFAPPAPRTPSIGQQLIGGLGTIAGTYGAFTGKSPMSLFKKHGGGLSDLPIIHAARLPLAQVHPDIGAYEGKYNFGDLLRKYNINPELYNYNPDYEPKDRGKGSVLSRILSDEDIAKEVEFHQDTMSVRGVPKSSMELAAEAEAKAEEEKKITSKQPIKIISKELPPGSNIISGPDSPTPPPQLETPDRGNIPTQRQMQQEKYRMDQTGIREAEDAYQKLLADRAKTNQELLAESKDARTRAQYANMAQFFARLGTATPKSEGLSGVLGAGLEAASQTLPEFTATNEKFRAERTAIRKDIDNNKIDAAKTKIAKLEKRAEKQHTRSREELEDIRHNEDKKSEELRWNKVYEQKEREINNTISQAGRLDLNDSKNIESLIKSRYFGGSFNAEGNLVFSEGKALDNYANSIAGALSEITGNIMQDQGLSFDSAQPFIRSIKDQIDKLPQDKLKQAMDDYPNYTPEAREQTITNFVDKFGIDRTILETVLKR